MSDETKSNLAKLNELIRSHCAGATPIADMVGAMPSDASAAYPKSIGELYGEGTPEVRAARAQVARLEAAAAMATAAREMAAEAETAAHLALGSAREALWDLEATR